jgi:hypothetical protein
VSIGLSYTWEFLLCLRCGLGLLLWRNNVQNWTRRWASCLSWVRRGPQAAIDIGVVVGIGWHISGPDWRLGISLLVLLDRDR